MKIKEKENNWSLINEVANERNLRYYYNNRDDILRKRKAYRDKNKKWLYANDRVRDKKRYKNDIQYRLAHKLRRNLNCALRYYYSTGKIPINRSGLIDYNMIIKSLGKRPSKDFCIDHIRPLCSFDLRNKEEIQKAFYYLNLRWITNKENRIKQIEDRKESLRRKR